MERTDLQRNFYDLSVADWQEWCEANHLPSFRATQLFEWQTKGIDSVDEMTNIGKSLRAKIADEFYIPGVEYREAFHSRDGSVKYLFRLQDGNLIETVFMPSAGGYTLCLSSQIGCRMGCAFCASAPLGLARNLSAGEMIAQVTKVQRYQDKRISNIVIMGIGEPLDNYDEIVRFLRRVNSPDGLNISMRHITLSTCGLVPEIARLAEEDMPITLSISLHGPDQKVRERLMPIARRYHFDDVIQAAKDYFDKTGRRVTYEYALFAGINDSVKQAEELALALKGQNAHVNLIPANPVPGTPFKRSPEEQVNRFRDALAKHHINATVRVSMGEDIAAACGQLRKSRIEADTE